MNVISKILACSTLLGMSAVAGAADRDFTQIVAQGEFTFDEMGSTWEVRSDITGMPVAASTNNEKDSSSKLIFSVTVPEGEKAVLSYTAVIEAKVPNGLAMFLDDGSLGNYMNNETRDECVVPVSVELESGTHTIELVHWITIDRVASGKQEDVDRSYIYGLSLAPASLAENEAALLDPTVNFGYVYIKDKPQTVTKEIRLINKGTNPLSVTGISGTDGFGGEIPSARADTGEELSVKLSFTASQPGEFTGTITLGTTAGEFTVECSSNVARLGKDVVYFTGFETGMDGWTLRDADNDGRNWMLSSALTSDRMVLTPYEGSEAAASHGWDPETGMMLSPENWMISPSIEIPETEKATLTFQTADNDYGESYQVMVSLNGPDADESDFTQVYDGYQYSQPWHEVSVDLTEYAGKTVNIAFRHNYSNQWLMIDNIMITADENSGIESITTNPEIESIEYFRPDGRRTSAASDGIVITVTTYKDKSVSVKKKIGTAVH